MNKYYKNNSTNTFGGNLLLFLINPLFSLIYSLKSLEKRSSLFFVFLFCVFFGMAFTVSNVRLPGSPDGVSYRLMFEEYSYVGMSDYVLRAQEYFTFDSDIKDLYAETIAFIISRFTSNYHVFFMVIALIFAYFQLKSLAFLTRNRNYVGNTVCLLLVFLFTFIQIKNINGLRFWTAYWMACYAIMNIFLKERKLFFILLFVLPFVHGSYVVLWSLILLFLLTKKYNRVWNVLLVLSFFVGNFSLSIVRDTEIYLPSFLSQFVDQYASDSAVAAKDAAGSGFYILDEIFPVFVNVYLYIMLYLIIRSRDLIKDRRVQNIYSFTIILVTFSNFMMPVPSLGGRFMALSYPFIAYLWLDIFGTDRYRRVIYCMPFVFIMSIYHLFRSYWFNVDRLFYISSPIVDLVRFL